MQFEVKSGNRRYSFDGRLLAESTSHRRGSPRWVEFGLYLTASGTYICERVGRSEVFHHIECEVVDRNGLKYDPEDHLEDWHVPCLECDPDEYLDDIVLEKPRYFALVSDSPAAILDFLHKEDDKGTRYMTKVGERLIEEASKYDMRLKKAYEVEVIP